MPYRCIASSPEGLVQQVAVSYLRHGYWWYVTGRIPEGKDCENHAYVPIVVEGVLELLDPGADPDLPCVYTMQGESVRTYY